MREIACHHRRRRSSLCPRMVWAVSYFTDHCCPFSVSQLQSLLHFAFIILIPWLISPWNNVSVYRSLAPAASNRYSGVSRKQCERTLECWGKLSNHSLAPASIALSAPALGGVIRILLCAAVLNPSWDRKGRGHLMSGLGEVLTRRTSN